MLIPYLWDHFRKGSQALSIDMAPYQRYCTQTDALLHEFIWRLCVKHKLSNNNVQRLISLAMRMLVVVILGRRHVVEGSILSTL